MSVGSFSAFSGAQDATGLVEVDCLGVLGTPLDSFTLKLGPGLHGSFAAREMRSGADALSYNLYTDVARTTIWGDGTSGTSVVTLTNTLSLLT